MWHQLSTKLVQYMAPENLIRPPDVSILLEIRSKNRYNVAFYINSHQLKKLLKTRSRHERVHQNRTKEKSVNETYHCRWHLYLYLLDR